MLRLRMKLTALFLPKLVSRIPGSLMQACVDPTTRKVKHQLCHQNSRRNSECSSGDESLLAGELSDGGRGWDSGEHVPKGFIAVLVGPRLRRFVIPISFLTMPEMALLMDRVADELECEYDGAIEIPCDEDHFEGILITCLARHRLLSSSRTRTAFKFPKIPRYRYI